MMYVLFIAVVAMLLFVIYKALQINRELQQTARNLEDAVRWAERMAGGKAHHDADHFEGAELAEKMKGNAK